ncbi:MAG: bifunctional oligoribonuclease/PAP phosphatase NrnA [Treponema sp.]|uniref:DHH family phosphoesterase n=1 Tax=Treponema sp. TaxID=166 RepID=UPI001B6F2610|nr:bifunctional oligoribonuclease/PAP phosphatase NrnA [Treponema sp.]MBP5402868.1 bifunctional oligoribonuclease/PAP phosphatase NrnA [Treponema sp.]MBR5933662.1 bifunctional oligoribonuclease/PAP phosphatase NrnA [Treponema sp.]
MKDITEKQISNFKEFILKHNRFIITGHKDPDGDCVSSILAISYIIESFKKPFLLLNNGPFKRSEIKEFENKFVTEIPFMSQDDINETGLIITDCSELSRLGEVGDLKDFDTFIIDHHKTSSGLDENSSIVDPSSPAASCIVQILYEKIAGPLTKKAADTLFFGLCTDTGFFRFLREDSSNIFLLTSRLVAAGANPNKMYDRITGGKPYSTRKLLGLTLGHAERYCNGRLVIAYETMEETKRYGQEGRDSDMLYQALLSSEGVDVAVFVRQETEHSCTAGFRSRDDIDVSVIASKFGGGGHKNASGMSCDGKIEKLIPQIVQEFSKILK